MDNEKKLALIKQLKKEASPAKVGPLTKLVAAITGAPFKATGAAMKSMAAGNVAARGVHAGKRLRYVGRKTISPHEYHSLRHQAKAKGGLPGEVTGVPAITKVRGPQGQVAYQKDHYRPGGLLGFAMKHPVITGLGGYVGYKMLTAPKYPSPAGSALPGPQQAQINNPNPWG